MTWIYLKLKGKPKLEWAKAELKKELHKGIHTYSACDCGRKMCRANKCVLCWEEEIKKLKKELKIKKRKSRN